jgi:hypothetical protein
MPFDGRKSIKIEVTDPILGPQYAKLGLSFLGQFQNLCDMRGQVIGSNTVMIPGGPTFTMYVNPVFNIVRIETPVPQPIIVASIEDVEPEYPRITETVYSWFYEAYDGSGTHIGYVLADADSLEPMTLFPTVKEMPGGVSLSVAGTIRFDTVYPTGQRCTVTDTTSYIMGTLIEYDYAEVAVDVGVGYGHAEILNHILSMLVEKTSDPNNVAPYWSGWRAPMSSFGYAESVRDQINAYIRSMIVVDGEIVISSGVAIARMIHEAYTVGGEATETMTYTVTGENTITREFEWDAVNNRHTLLPDVYGTGKLYLATAELLEEE